MNPLGRPGNWTSGFNQGTDAAGRIYVSGSSVGDDDFLILSNMGAVTTSFTLPVAPSGRSWVRIADTDGWAEGSHNCWTATSGAISSRSTTPSPGCGG